MNIAYKRLTFVVGIIITVIIISAGFIFTPLTGDLKVFMAASNQADYISNNLIIGAYQSWELKGVFNRTLMYLIYKIVTLFVPFSCYAFEVGCKIVYAMIMFLLLCWSSTLLFQSRKRQLCAAVAMMLVLMSTHTVCHMQAEMSGTIFIIMAFSLYTNALTTKKNVAAKLFIAGLFIGSLFFFKSVLLLLSVTVVAAVAIQDLTCGRKHSLKKLFIVIAGSICMLIVNMVFIMVINPNEITDMLDASVFQSTLLSQSFSPLLYLKVIYHFCRSYLSYVRMIPIIIVGTVAFICNFARNILNKKGELIFWHIVMWIMPTIFVMLSNKFFAYHYNVFIFPSIVECYLCVRDILERRKKAEQIAFVFSAVVGTIIYVGWLSIASVNVQTYIKQDLRAYKETKDLLTDNKFDAAEKVLYLDDGGGAYMLGGRSHLKYYYPLPLQRLDVESQMECYITSMEEALTYDGKYISAYEDWFFKEGKNQAIKEKIEDEYRLIGEYPFFVPPYLTFLKPSDNSAIRYYRLYERIN